MGIEREKDKNKKKYKEGTLCFSMPFVQIINVYIEKQKKQRTKAEFNRKERTVRESEQ